MVTPINADMPDHQLPGSILLVSQNREWSKNLQVMLTKALGPDIHVTIIAADKLADSVKRIQPDLLMVDLSVIVGDPLTWLKNLLDQLNSIRILLISDAVDAVLAGRLIRAGAHGYLLKSDIQDHLLDALHLIAGNERYVSEDVMQELLHAMSENPHEPPHLPLERLSDREVVIFRFLGQGQSIGDIAQELGLNIKTVSTHCKNIRTKLDIPTNRNLIQAGSEWLETIQSHPQRQGMPHE